MEKQLYKRVIYRLGKYLNTLIDFVNSESFNHANYVIAINIHSDNENSGLSIIPINVYNECLSYTDDHDIICNLIDIKNLEKITDNFEGGQFWNVIEDNITKEIVGLTATHEKPRFVWQETGHYSIDYKFGREVSKEIYKYSLVKVDSLKEGLEYLS